MNESHQNRESFYFVCMEPSSRSQGFHRTLPNYNSIYDSLNENTIHVSAHFGEQNFQLPYHEGIRWWEGSYLTFCNLFYGDPTSICWQLNCLIHRKEIFGIRNEVRKVWALESNESWIRWLEILWHVIFIICVRTMHQNIKTTQEVTGSGCGTVQMWRTSNSCVISVFCICAISKYRKNAWNSYQDQICRAGQSIVSRIMVALSLVSLLTLPSPTQHSQSSLFSTNMGYLCNIPPENPPLSS